MRKTSKCIIILLIVIMILGSVSTGLCEHRTKIVFTVYAAYDWCLNILGERAADMDIVLLMDNGVDMHNYQPTAQDITEIASCDLFVCVGEEVDSWLDGVLGAAANDNIKMIQMLECIEGLEQVVVEGMQNDAHHEHEHEHRHENVVDEHVWLSLHNAQSICAAICDAICVVDSAHAQVYHANTQAYIDELQALDIQYCAMVNDSSLDTILVADRFPFRYLAADYDLNYYAAFSGCSAETEASFATIAFLISKTEELNLDVILTCENSDKKIANTIIENSNRRDIAILTLNSMQSLNRLDLERGISYVQIMSENLIVLQQALHTAKGGVQ